MQFNLNRTWYSTRLDWDNDVRFSNTALFEASWHLLIAGRKATTGFLPIVGELVIRELATEDGVLWRLGMTDSALCRALYLQSEEIDDLHTVLASDENTSSTPFVGDADACEAYETTISSACMPICRTFSLVRHRLTTELSNIC